jgi:hypothetical protein
MAMNFLFLSISFRYRISNNLTSVPNSKYGFCIKLFLYLDLFQQSRLFPYVAAAYAIKIFSDYFSKLFGEFTARTMMGDKSDEMVRRQEVDRYLHE